MKCINLFLCGVIMLLTGLLNEAEGKEHQFNFKTQQSNPDKLDCWYKNKGASDPEGKYTVVKGKDGKNTLKITSHTKDTIIAGARKLKIKAGDILEVKLKIKGAGKGFVGFYFNGSKSYLGSAAKVFTPQPDWKEYKFTFTVKDSKPENPATACRLWLGIGANSKVLFKDVSVLNKGPVTIPQKSTATEGKKKN